MQVWFQSGGADDSGFTKTPIPFEKKVPPTGPRDNSLVKREFFLSCLLKRSA